MVDLVNELEKYYRTIQPGDLLGKYVLKTFGRKSVSAEDPVLQKLNELLIHTGDGHASGLVSFKEIIQGLSSVFKGQDIKELHDKVKIFHDEVLALPDAEKAYYNDETDRFTMASVLGIDTVKPEAKKFGVIMCSTPMVSFPVRDVNKVSLFMNTIPTIEMSRCIPYLNVGFQFRHNKDDGFLRSPSLLKFLNGGMDMSKAGSADLDMFKAAQDSEAGPGGETKTVSIAGMELMTAPPMLFNPSSIETSAARRYSPVLDVFRPFMSIDSFDVIAAPSVGMFSYKTAKLNLVLHDRSRLAEISDFVRPEVYTNTTLNISYGWNHPDGINSENAYGDLLNQMVVKNEKYGIVNVSFSFDNAQQVHITLQLAMKGVQELRVVKISEGTTYASAEREIQKLIEDINRLREKAGLKKPESTTKEIRVYSQLDSVENGQLMTAFKDNAEFEGLIKNLKKNPNKSAADELAEALKKIFSKDSKKPGFLEVQSQTIKSFIKDKMKKLKEGPDPFLDGAAYPEEIAANGFNADFVKGDPRPAKKVVSLAKCLAIFAVHPLLPSPNFDEIQMVFYQFNSQAGKARDTNIGSFPIVIADLEEVFEDHIAAKRNVDMTINEFVLLLQSAIINNPRALAYGLRMQYKKEKGKETTYIGKEGLENDFARIMKGQGGTFKFPAVEAYVETRGGRVLKNGERSQEKAQHDILRIHIFDKQATPYDQFLELIRTQTGFQEIIEKSDKAPNKETLRDLVNLVKVSDVGLEYYNDPSTGERRIRAISAAAVKKVVSSALPSMTYGTNNSAIITANLATQQNQLLSTVQMLRTAGKQNSTEPNGSAVGGIPLRVIPCQLDMDTFGCPLFNINQQFFIDFSTGTTADNIYLLTHLEHKFKQGSFTSHLKFVPLDSYGALESIISKVDQIANILKKDGGKLSK